MALQVLDGRNPKFVTPEHTLITLDVLFEDENGDPMFNGAYLPFTASPDDTEEHGRQIFADCLKGAFGEVAPYEEPVVPLEELRAAKLQDLAAWFTWASDNAHLTSTVIGYEIDADETANRNIEGLIKAVEAGNLQEPVYFMDYDNQVRPVDLNMLKVMQLEVIANGQALYQQKWALRSAIEAAQSKAELDAIEIPAVGGSDAGAE